MATEHTEKSSNIEEKRESEADPQLTNYASSYFKRSLLRLKLDYKSIPSDKKSQYVIYNMCF
jgi:hypothetical protein